MSKQTYANCMDCPAHKIINDADPDDWFCDDDKAIVCTLEANPSRNTASRNESDHSPHRVVMCAIRPYKLCEEGDSPPWCPLKAPAVAA